MQPMFLSANLSMSKTTWKSLSAAAQRFERTYDGLWEDEADMQRGEFLGRFPIGSLPTISLQDYAIGQNKGQTFCHWAEPGTDKWARIKGSSADKFGIYYGIAANSPQPRFRYTKKFSGTLPATGAEGKVFRIIRDELLALVESGSELDFAAVDGNRLSPMLKAKVLSLYFDDLYLPVCSIEKLMDIAVSLDIGSDSPSEVQFEALQFKKGVPELSGWSNLKFAAFLLRLISGDREGDTTSLPKPLPRVPKVPNLDAEPDFEEMQRRAKEKGEKSERFAREREEARLRSRGLSKLIPKIRDLTKKPRHGYDFHSFSDYNEPRYIEVKTFTGSRFYLSANELRVAQSEEHGPRYFFYLVTYGKDGEPEDCHVLRSADVLAWCGLTAQSFLVKAPADMLKRVARPD